MVTARALIRVDPGMKAGTIRPLHGVNGGPICLGGLVDLSSRHTELKTPIMRLHDCEWPHPSVVDIPAIFPDFQADPKDPASYQFDQTDDYLQSIVDLGAAIVYRLGTSIEHTRRRYHTHPPMDLPKWADICVHIIDHYNGGWADGFEHNIRYWEIWNEPDIGAPMWSGTLSDYLQLYATTVRAIKQYDGSLMVGGPAAARLKEPFLSEFLDGCQRLALPLDFCSWHSYTMDPFQILEYSRQVRDLLDRHGFPDAESHLNEWNLGFDWGTPESRRASFDTLQGAPGASFAAAVLILLQDSSVDVANYFNGGISWFGLFDTYGEPRKTFHAFKAFSLLQATPHRILCEVRGADRAIVGCGGVSEDGKVVQLLVSNVSSSAQSWQLTIENPPHPGEVELSVLAGDRDHDLSEVRRQQWKEAALSFEQEMPGHSFRLIRLEWRPEATA